MWHAGPCQVSACSLYKSHTIPFVASITASFKFLSSECHLCSNELHLFTWAYCHLLNITITISLFYKSFAHYYTSCKHYGEMLWAFFALILWHLVFKHQLNSHLKVFSYIYNHLPLNVVSAAELPVNKKAAAVFSEACQLNKNANLNVFMLCFAVLIIDILSFLCKCFCFHFSASGIKNMA